jgi:drug/metabolite transporter (DMT)-like permease
MLPIKQQVYRKRKGIKYFLVILFCLLLVGDIILAVKSNNENFKLPTYSKLFFINKPQMLWFIYVFGCLVGKVFYNRIITRNPKAELKGIAIILTIVLFLYIMGAYVFKLLYQPADIPDKLSFVLFIAGLVSANQLWPQYKKGTNS